MAVILIVDDEPEIVRGLEDNLRFEGYSTVSAGNVIAAGQQVDAATASLALAGHDLRIERLEVESGRGRLTAGGTYDLRTRQLAIDAISARDYPLRPVPADAGAREGRLLFALSGTADLDASLRGGLHAAMDGHQLARGSLMGRYARL